MTLSAIQPVALATVVIPALQSSNSSVYGRGFFAPGAPPNALLCGCLIFDQDNVSSAKLQTLNNLKFNNTILGRRRRVFQRLSAAAGIAATDSVGNVAGSGKPA